MKHHQYFGPFPLSYKEIADKDTLNILAHVMNGVAHEIMKPFEYVTDREINKEDKEFILKVMKLDPRERPTAKEYRYSSIQASSVRNPHARSCSSASRDASQHLPT